jgi:hypothetical protein
VLEIRWNPGHDSAVLGLFGELYALAHTIQRSDAYCGEDKQESDCFGVERAHVKCRALSKTTPAMNSWPFILGVRPTVSQLRDFSI